MALIVYYIYWVFGDLSEIHAEPCAIIPLGLLDADPVCYHTGDPDAAMCGTDKVDEYPTP